ncbi:hypothetical protein [Tahibacter soli]|uniref:Uncharacterized protein n=1 Tax=Tahibacter soli TaxID=2983605 RepID=A0A9X4BJD0_9GAMM|nr:hypothetical protein [Tahibacter soli]MDC8016215.1 hypothetical protein [Tahibacter soli]
MTTAGALPSPALAGRTLADLDYAELSAIALAWFARIDTVAGAPVPLAHVRPRLNALRLSSLERLLRPRTAVERALYELFAMARVRRSVLCYLSLQEGRDWDGAGGEFAHHALLLRQILQQVGRRAVVSVGVSLFGRRLRLRLDPLRHVRALYLDCLTYGERANRPFARTRQRFLFRAQAWLLHAGFRNLVSYRLRLGRRAAIDELLRSRSVRRNAALFLLILFPSARTLDGEQWSLLLDRLAEYFAPRLHALRELLPVDSLLNHGIAKLLKILFGVVVSRIAARPAADTDEITFVVDTLRLAYCWGTTYPLVDNVLDDAATPADVRGALVTGLTRLFSGDAGDAEPGTPPLALEAIARLREVLTLCPAPRLPAIRQTLAMLLESHRRDSERRLSHLPTVTDAGLIDAVWSDSVLKAALIRIATMEICGTPVTAERLSAQLSAALINQWGDDLWDIGEDCAGDRVTPFTLYVRDPRVRNPFVFFVEYCRRRVAAESPDRQRAMYLGVLETCRCLIDAPPSDPAVALLATGAMESALAGAGWVEDGERLKDVPHVDPDAVTFGIEHAFLR